MNEILFIVCIAVICVLAVVLAVWLIVSLVRRGKESDARGKIVVVDESAYELVPLGEEFVIPERPAAAVQSAEEQVAVQTAAEETAASETAYFPSESEGGVMFVRNEILAYPEAYLRLSSAQRGYIDEILRYAEGKEGVKKVVNDKAATVYLGKKLVVRIMIRRGIITARLTVQNNDFEAYTDSAGLKLKTKPIDIKVENGGIISAIKDIIDITYRDLLEERGRKEEEKKQQRRERRRLAREAKLAAAKQEGNEDETSAPDPELKGGDEPAENGIPDDEAVDGRDNNEETESVAGTADPDTDSDEEL